MHVYNNTIKGKSIVKEDSSSSTLLQHLQSLYRKYGEFVSNNGYYILDDPSIIPLIMDHITQGGKFERSCIPRFDSSSSNRSSPGVANVEYETERDDEHSFYDIASIRYLGHNGYDSTTADKKPVLPTSKSSPMVTIRFTNGGVAQFRASGTEPKFKYYMELRGQPGVDRTAVQHELEQWSQAVLQEYLPLSRFSLRRPTTNK